MKHASVRAQTKGGKAAQGQAKTLASFKRIVDARIRKVEEKMRQEVAGLRDELHASEIAFAATRLRLLNQRQAHEGLGRLRADLANMRELGILGPDGKRTSKEPPAEILEQAYDV